MNKTILVTGSNRGIGLAIVAELAKKSDDLILLACRDISSGKEAAKNIEGNIKVVELDLDSSESIHKHTSAIQTEYDIDILINNAGLLDNDSFLEAEPEKTEKVIFVNALAPLELIRLVTPTMAQNGFGRIINMSSGWGSFSEGLTGPFSYSISKASLNAITLSLSQDLPECITINSVCPGWVKTRMGGDSAPRTPEEGAQTAVWLATTDHKYNGKFFRDKEEISW